MEGTISEIRLWAANFEPRYWAFCDGRLLAIRNFTPLFALIGTYYGGDGRTTFALPDLRGRIFIGAGEGPGLPYYNQGQAGGVENATLTISQLPPHTHQIRASSQAGSLAGPAGAYPAGSNVQKIYGSAADVLMTDTVVGPQSALAQHDNMMPYLCCNYIICLHGYFPMRD